jgi:hypothetical protein
MANEVLTAGTGITVTPNAIAGTITVAHVWPAPRVVTTTATAAAGQVIDANATAASFVVTLPAANSCAGRSIVISKIDDTPNTVTVQSAGGTMNGQTSWVLNAQWNSMTFVSSGTDWRIN